MLINEQSEVVNIASALDEMVAKQPYKQSIIFPQSRDQHGNVSYTHLTFRQLWQESNQIAHGLANIGITKGTRTVLMVKPSLEFFSIFFAMFRAGIVPVLIDPGMGTENLKTCISEAEPEAFIGIPKAQLARKLLQWGKNTIKKSVIVGSKVGFGNYTLAEIKDSAKSERDNPVILSTKSDDMAAILFTSGSTGVPKGVMYQHRNFQAQVDMIRETYDIEPGEINLPTFPPFALFDPALGMTTVVPDMDATKPAEVNPLRIIEAINDFGVTNMFGSPALINTLSRYCAENNIVFPTLKRVLSAGAPVPPAVLARFHKSLTGEAQIFTPYGATESLPIASISSKEILSDTQYKTNIGLGTCVGRPVSNMEVKIIAITEEAISEWNDDLVLPNGQIGEIVVKAPQVTIGYFKREQATLVSKIKDGDQIRHRMGDLGYFDDQGRLWFCGRKAHRVETDSETLYTIKCEAIFNNHQDVYRSALVGVDFRGTIKPVICIELEKNSPRDHLEIKEELKQMAENNPVTNMINSFLIHPGFPVDIRHNSKIFREKLKVWAQKFYE